MNRSTKLALLLAGAGVGGIVATYVLLRRNREKIDRAAQRSREIADQADRIANTLEGVRCALGPESDEEREGAEAEK